MHGAFYHRGPAEVKRLIIEALQEHFAEHPAYTDPDGPGVLIRNKFSRDERHKRQIVVTTAAASPQRLSLSADFGGHVHGSVVLARLRDRKGTALEWVSENPIEKIKPRPGIYLVEMETDNEFRITPYYTVQHEILYPYVDRADGDKIKIVLKNKPVEVDSDFLILDEHLPLERGKDYTIDYNTGIITLPAPITDACLIAAEYRWIGEASELFCAARQVYNIAAMPGVILCFGRKIQAGSQQAVVVLKSPEHIADFWTGRWTVSVTLDIYTQDPIEQDEFAEEVAQTFWYWNTERWADQGLALVGPPDIAGGTESQEDEVTDEYSFGNSVSMTVAVDWEAFVPVLRSLRTVNVSGYHVSPFDTPGTALKKGQDAQPDGQFGNIIDRQTLPGKGVQPVPDMRRYFSGPYDPRLTQLHRELFDFDAKRASGAMSQFYGSVDPANPDAPSAPVNLPEVIPVSEFTDSPVTEDGVALSEPGVFSEDSVLSMDRLPPDLKEELRKRSRR